MCVCFTLLLISAQFGKGKGSLRSCCGGGQRATRAVSTSKKTKLLLNTTSGSRGRCRTSAEPWKHCIILSVPENAEDNLAALRLCSGEVRTAAAVGDRRRRVVAIGTAAVALGNGCGWHHTENGNWSCTSYRKRFSGVTALRAQARCTEQHVLGNNFLHGNWIGARDRRLLPKRSLRLLSPEASARHLLSTPWRAIVQPPPVEEEGAAGARADLGVDNSPQYVELFTSTFQGHRRRAEADGLCAPDGRESTTGARSRKQLGATPSSRRGNSRRSEECIAFTGNISVAHVAGALNMYSYTGGGAPAGEV